MDARLTEVLRLLIADDHDLLRRGLREVLEEDGDIRVVAEATDGEDAVRLAHELYPRGLDLVLMDLEMPRMDGLEATRRILAEVPGLPVIAMTASTEDRDVIQAVGAGMVGFLTKAYSPDAILRALRGFRRNGALPMSRTMAATLLAYYREKMSAGTPAAVGDPRPGARAEVLTAREREVIKLLTEGATDREIALRLSIAQRTVRVHLQSIFRKVRAHNRTEAVDRYRTGRH
jgi:DNA-binding NarL/FixJ family response regulator